MSSGPNGRPLPPKLYFRIGEVAGLVGVEPHVLRYWEREFRSIRPTKSAKGQRVYSRRDVENLMRVRELLYREGFTIAGAKKRLESEMGGRGSTPSAMASLPETVVANVVDPPPGGPGDEVRALLLEVRDELRGMLTLLDKGDRKVN